jgi:hypothetical protein
MPVLPNTKHENFCRLTVEGARYGWTQADIYKRAGYRADGHSAEMAASRLMKNDEIRQRIAELMRPAERKARFTAETLNERLDKVYSGATATGQFGPAVRAAEVQGKLHGLLVDKLEVGRVGDFDACDSIAAIADKVMSDLSGVAEDPRDLLPVFDQLRAAIVERIATAAYNVTPARPQIDSAEAAVATLRRSPSGRR